MTNSPPESQSNDSQQILAEIRELKDQVERFNDRFTNYQQATQWVVQLTFTVIASATITVIITSVVKK